MVTMTFLQHCQCIKAGCFGLTPVQFIEEHCQLRTGDLRPKSWTSYEKCLSRY